MSIFASNDFPVVLIAVYCRSISCLTLLYYLLFVEWNASCHIPRSHGDSKLVYSSLSTCQSTYLTWILLRSSPIPTVIKHSDLGYNVCQDLHSSSHAIGAPPLINDLAESLPWLLWEVPFLLATSYVTITINLQHVCECKNNGHIHPSEAHL